MSDFSQEKVDSIYTSIGKAEYLKSACIAALGKNGLSPDSILIVQNAITDIGCALWSLIAMAGIKNREEESHLQSVKTDLEKQVKKFIGLIDMIEKGKE